MTTTTTTSPIGSRPKHISLGAWLKGGDPWVWFTAAAVAVSLLLVIGLLTLIAARGLGHFWPHTIYEIDYQGPAGNREILMGEIRDSERIPVSQLDGSGFIPEEGAKEVTRLLIKQGNRDVGGQEFRWIIEPSISRKTKPLSAVVIERREWGNLYGYLLGVRVDGELLEGDALSNLEAELGKALSLYDRIEKIERSRLASVNYQLERVRLQRRGLELDGDNNSREMAELTSRTAELQAEYQALEGELAALYASRGTAAVDLQIANGSVHSIAVNKLISVHTPNAYSVREKLVLYAQNFWKFVSDEPREANTEGGIFPAIFGTVLMVLLMSIFVTPFGVLAAVYLREYARQGLMTKIIRVAVNNLAGVPSIVYGVFGLGLFVYAIGGSIDQLFYPEALPSPTFGTGGLFWASLTLALLTLPVVIVSTEEGLARIPRSMREGSLALGATKAETLWKTVIPMASPGIMTGLILAVARAAGEVAPLMLVGVVKLAPSLPLDGNAPFLHLERKFMHLGFHIYDVGFQSPNVEASTPLVYATALLLVVVIIILNLVAVGIRNRLREKYRELEN